MFPSPFPFMLGLPLFDLYWKKPSFFNFIPRASQLPSLFLAISYTTDVILLDIANVFQILISASWFWRNSRGIWVILILFCWNHRNLKWSVGFSLDPCSISDRTFSLTWRASTPICWNKIKCLYKKRVQLPQDWFGTPTWPPFLFFGTTIWPPWRHVKTQN